QSQLHFVPSLGSIGAGSGSTLRSLFLMEGSRQAAKSRSSALRRRGLREAPLRSHLHRLLAPAFLRRRPPTGQVEGAVDQPHVREGLREVARQPPVCRVVSLGEQSEVVAYGKQPLEQPRRIVVTAQ